MNYDNLLLEADSNSLVTKEKPLKAYDGRIKGNKILIRKDMDSVTKACVLAEELGHYHTTVGDILDQSLVENRKQELRARTWAYNKLVGLRGIIDAYKAGCKSLYESAQFLDVTEEFLNECVECYRQKYGICTTLDNYIIYFEPALGVLELV